jgi:hypothetical protein
MLARCRSCTPAARARAGSCSRHVIEAHLTIVFAALAVSHWIAHTTGWSIKSLSMRRYRTVEIQSRDHTITAADPLPPGAHTALEAIRANPGRH